MEYTIPAIPTVYRGRRYRSRLEARWAAFFELLGFNAEYEPCDLGAWSPDFSLSVEGCLVGLVEIKPISQFDEDIALKMRRAGPSYSFAGRQGGALLLLGVKPDIGWQCWLNRHTQRASKWEPVRFVWMIDPDEPTMFPVFVPESMADRPALRSYPDHIEELWVDAANAVQWKGPRS